MKGNEQPLMILNQLPADELTAISQDMVHSEMCDSWGYDKLHSAIEHQAKDEMHHAETRSASAVLTDRRISEAIRIRPARRGVL